MSFNGFTQLKPDSKPPNPLLFKRWATGTFALPGTTPNYTVSGLSFVPTYILIHFSTNPNDISGEDAAFNMVPYDGSTSQWRQSVKGWADPKPLPASKPTTKQFIITQQFSSSYTMYTRWWAFARE